MFYFLNFKNGTASIGTCRLTGAQVTDVNDIVNAKNDCTDEILTASLDVFIRDEAIKIMPIAEQCESRQELDDYILGDGDFLELLLEREFNLSISDYPELRDFQKSQFEHIEFASEA